jgi:hypothetical protein
MRKHRHPKVMQSRVATLLSILRTIVELATAVVKLWHSQ